MLVEIRSGFGWEGLEIEEEFKQLEAKMRETILTGRQRRAEAHAKIEAARKAVRDCEREYIDVERITGFEERQIELRMAEIERSYGSLHSSAYIKNYRRVQKLLTELRSADKGEKSPTREDIAWELNALGAEVPDFGKA